jgi:hypothetical protein
VSLAEERSLNRSVGLQIWVIGALAPVILIFAGKFGEYDFAAFWVAGRQALGGEAANIYSTVATQVYADQLGLGGPTIFPYPPQALFIFLPFALVPYIPGYLIWNVVSAALFYWAARPFLPKGCPPILSVLTPAAITCIDFGQTGLIFGALWLHAFRGNWPAVAVLTFKPHLGLLSILAIRNRRAFFAVTVVASALLFASLMLFGAGVWQSFVDHSFNHALRIANMKRWLFAGVSPAIGYGFLGWIPFAAAGALLLARNVNVFTAATASFLISPYGFHYDMTVAALGFGLLVFGHWHDMSIRHRIPIAIGFLSPVIAILGAWWIPPLLLWALWAQTKYDLEKVGTMPAAQAFTGQ